MRLPRGGRAESQYSRVNHKDTPASEDARVEIGLAAFRKSSRLLPREGRKGGSSHRARERNVLNCQRYAAATPSFFLSPLNASLPAKNRASGTRQIHRTSADEICTIGLGMSQCCRRAGAGLNTICKVPSPASDTFAKQMPPEIHCIPASSPASTIGRPATGKQKKENGPENTAKTRGNGKSPTKHGGPRSGRCHRGSFYVKKMNRGWENRRRLAFGAENSVSSTTRKWSTLLEARRNTSLQVGEEKSAVPHIGPASSLRKTKKAATETPGCTAGRERNRRGYRCVTKGKKQQNK